MNINDPVPTISASAGRRSSSSYGHGTCCVPSMEDKPPYRVPSMEDKPPYRVPSMEEIGAIPWNGLRVASTFSGCGGSCLGYRMAGYRVVWANEFLPIAQESYRANASKDCFLDGRDVRQVTPEDILSCCGLKQGELDLFDGSPPCQAFSMAGKRSKGWGQAKVYENGVRQCNETLFVEYIRLLRGLMPRAFVAENVSGLVKGVAKGYFLEIMRDMKASGYRVACRVLDAQWLGVPQQRRRAIFIGVREDMNREPAYPTPLPYRYSVRDALPWIGRCVHDTGGAYSAGDVTHRCAPTIMSGRANVLSTDDDGRLPPSRQGRGAYAMQRVRPERPCPTITIASPGNDLGVDEYRPCRSVTTDGSGGSRGGVQRKFTIDEVKRLCAFPDDFALIGSYAKQWERLGNSVPPVMMYHIASIIRDKILFA